MKKTNKKKQSTVHFFYGTIFQENAVSTRNIIWTHKTALNNFHAALAHQNRLFHSTLSTPIANFLKI